MFNGNRIDINLEKYQLAPGDMIKGVVQLTLTAPIQAEKLSVNFSVTKEVKQMNIARVTQGSVSSAHTKSKIYSFSLPLDGNKEYVSGEYPFEMSIPPEALPQEAPSIQNALGGGMLGNALGMLAQFSPVGRAIYTYELEAQLDVPWKIDLRKKVDITIG